MDKRTKEYKAMVAAAAKRKETEDTTRLIPVPVELYAYLESLALLHGQPTVTGFLDIVVRNYRARMTPFGG